MNSENRRIGSKSRLIDLGKKNAWLQIVDGALQIMVLQSVWTDNTAHSILLPNRFSWAHFCINSHLIDHLPHFLLTSRK